MKKEKVLAKIAGLSKLDVTQLRNLWSELFGKEAPPYNRSYIEGRIAYRLQEVAFGGLKEETKERIKNICQGKQDNKSGTRPAKPQVGTILVREFQGIEHRVKVLADGFDYKGIKYHSLTGVAKKITGTSWSGLRFFGLKGQE